MSIVCTVDLNNTILDTCISSDTSRAYNLTKDKAVIMGRLSWESRKRKGIMYAAMNIVVTSTPEEFYEYYSIVFVNSLDKAIEMSEKYELEYVVIGGQEMFKTALLHGGFTKLYLSRMFTNYDLPARTFPIEIVQEDFKLTNQSQKIFRERDFLLVKTGIVFELWERNEHQ